MCNDTVLDAKRGREMEKRQFLPMRRWQFIRKNVHARITTLYIKPCEMP